MDTTFVQVVNGAMTGRKHSFKSKGKMSKSRKETLTGCENPFYGKHHSIDTISRSSVSRIINGKQL